MSLPLSRKGGTAPSFVVDIQQAFREGDELLPDFLAGRCGTSFFLGDVRERLIIKPFVDDADVAFGEIAGTGRQSHDVVFPGEQGPHEIVVVFLGTISQEQGWLLARDQVDGSGEIGLGFGQAAEAVIQLSFQIVDEAAFDREAVFRHRFGDGRLENIVTVELREFVRDVGNGFFN